MGGTGERIAPNIPNTYNVSNENPSFLISNGEFYGGNRYPNRPFNNLGGFNNFTNFAGPMSSSCRNSVVSLPLVGSHGNIPQINVLGPRIQQLANDLKMDNLSTNNNHIGKSSMSYFYVYSFYTYKLIIGPLHWKSRMFCTYIFTRMYVYSFLLYL